MLYGWRAKIGLLTPSNNNVIEPELYSVIPEGVSVLSTMMLLEGLADDQVQDMEAQGLRGVRELAAAQADVIVYACMGTAFAKERGWGRDFIEAAEAQSGIPCTTASIAMLDALMTLGIEKVAIGTAYPEHVNARIPDFLSEHGIKTTNLDGLLLDMDTVIWQSPQVAYGLGRRVDTEDADAVCLLATDFRTLDIVGQLKRDLGKPVITTNSALLWRALDIAGVNEPIDGLGELFKHRASPRSV